MNVRLILVYLIIFLAPVIINYGFLSWRGPGVNGDLDSWIGFFANYLGLIGAISIAIIQIKDQKERDNSNELQSNRSYIIAQEFAAPFNLKNVITSPNSRLIVNDYYNDAEEFFIAQFESNSSNENLRDFLGNITVQFYKFSHSGIPDVIIDCHIKIKVADSDNVRETYIVSSNIGTFEKLEEIFIPIVNINYREITPLNVQLDYKTIKGEQMRYCYNYEQKKEEHMIIVDGKIHLLHSIDVSDSTWIYPNKINR